MSTSLITKRRERPVLIGNVRVVTPFPATAYPQLWRWSQAVWDRLADDLTPNTAESFIPWQESIDRQQNVITWGVYRGPELGGLIRFIVDPLHPWMGDGHCLFKKDFYGQVTTVPALVSVIRELFNERGLKKINMATYKSNHAIRSLLVFLGARVEGEIRRVYMQHGELVDTVIHGMIPEDLADAIRDNPKLAVLCKEGA